ncbi:DNA polymerase IV [Mucilaginibacter auburnensis]|uniref:DNA polymerase IV n=1 Tax=Mucilaginibacter auburnensis TaxID=1457233 RepID=A0A2H9VW58_9SPHI|nr:DNA polymerase IV [Mucilaginibacter auburnensis]PJJ85055.1 DNA polymerase-4 [Mucilaginibacter auburnensis]
MSDLSDYRKIIHIDMDAFYASVEQRDNPEFVGKALIVGGLPEGRGGVVATASYEARRFGVRSAMPSKQALQLCPDAIFVKPRFDAYKEVSRQIREIFKRYTDLIEPLSLDEAYLDVTQDKQGIGSALTIAHAIKEAIRSELRLTASAGVSVNKFVAKIASDINKPDGMKFIGPSAIETFMEQLPVEKFYGVGKVTAAKMKAMGLFTGADLKQLSEAELLRNFGKTGSFYYQIVRGIDERPVTPSRPAKSLAAEDTFAYDLRTLEEMEAQLDTLALIVYGRLNKSKLQSCTVTLKVKYHDFKQITRNRSFLAPIDDLETITRVAKELLALNFEEGQRVRLLGISLSNFARETEQLRLF